MVEIDILKEERKVIRRRLTKLIEMIGKEIVLIKDVNVIEEWVCLMMDIYDRLVKSNAEIISFVKTEDLDAEFEGIMEYRDKVDLWKYRLSKKIEQLNKSKEDMHEVQDCYDGTSIRSEAKDVLNHEKVQGEAEEDINVDESYPDVYVNDEEVDDNSNMNYEVEQYGSKDEGKDQGDIQDDVRKCNQEDVNKGEDENKDKAEDENGFNQTEDAKVDNDKNEEEDADYENDGGDFFSKSDDDIDETEDAKMIPLVQTTKEVENADQDENKRVEKNNEVDGPKEDCIKHDKFPANGKAKTKDPIKRKCPAKEQWENSRAQCQTNCTTIGKKVPCTKITAPGGIWKKDIDVATEGEYEREKQWSKKTEDLRSKMPYEPAKATYEALAYRFPRTGIGGSFIFVF